VLFVSGDIKEQEVRSLVKKFFVKKTDAFKFVVPPLSSNEGSSKVVRIVHKEGAKQCEIKLGHLGVARSNPDHYKVLLLNQLLGGYFLSRLNMNLRQDKGITYGINSGFSIRERTGPFGISSAVQSENSTLAIDEIIKELKLITTEMVSDEELSNAKGYYSGVFPIAFETSDQILSGLSTIEANGFDDDYFRNFKEKINEVSKEDIYEAAKKYINPDKLIIVIGGDRNVIEDSLAKKYKVEVYDLYGKLLK
jgi:predicted Zn-dependent peptidase